jgi:hypothetical protein
MLYFFKDTLLNAAQKLYSTSIAVVFPQFFNIGVTLGTGYCQTKKAALLIELPFLFKLLVFCF